MKILVIGGTGMLGEPVALGLAERHDVSVMTRYPIRARQRLGELLRIVPGDVLDPESLDRAVSECEAVHINLNGRGDWDFERRGTEAVASAAARRGLRRITAISGATVCEQNVWFPMIRAKLAAERSIVSSGVAFTVFRCTMFMELLPNLVRNEKAFIMGRQPHRWHFVAAADYARMVEAAYATPASEGRILFVHGPDAFTMEEAMLKYCAACVPRATLTRIPFWMLSVLAALPGREELRDNGLPLMRYFARVPEMGDPTEANALLGAPRITLDEWCASLERRPRVE